MKVRIDGNLKSSTVGNNLNRLLQLLQLPLILHPQLLRFRKPLNRIRILQHHQHKVTILLERIILLMKVHSPRQPDHKFPHVWE